MADMSNPYRAPGADGEVAFANVYADGLPDAKQGTRLLHFIIDYVLYIGVCFVIGVVSVLIDQEELATFLTWPALIGYYVFFEGVFAATPGKMIMGSRVVQLDGSKPTLGQVFLRTIIRFVPFEAFSFLGSTSGWHDRWSKTRVIRAR